jgi:RHS repeat-associated protein
VYYDKVLLKHYKGQVLEEDHYYPFGLTLSTTTVNPLEKNNFKFVTKELQPDLGLNWYDFGARPFDMQTGRFITTDPHAEKYTSTSPSAYALNNPVLYNDINGMDPNHPWYAGFMRLFGIGYENAPENIREAREVNNNIHALSATSNQLQEGNGRMEDAMSWLPFGKSYAASLQLMTGRDPTGRDRSQGEIAMVGIGSGALDAFGGKVFGKVGGWLVKTEVHHIIPKQIFREGSELIENAVEGGFRQEAEVNKIVLAKFSKATGNGAHGNHPGYTDFIRSEMGKFSEGLEKAGQPITPENASKFMNDLMNRTRQTIEKNPDMKLNNLFRD